MYKILLKNGTNYQPQLVIGGFLNHQQYQPIFCHKMSCQAARRCGCRCVGLDIDGPPESQRTSGQRHLFWEFGVWTRFLTLHQVHWTGSCPCRWSGRWSLVLLVALWYVAATWGQNLTWLCLKQGWELRLVKQKQDQWWTLLKLWFHFTYPWKCHHNYEECVILSKLGPTNTCPSGCTETWGSMLLSATGWKRHVDLLTSVEMIQIHIPPKIKSLC